MLTGTYIAPIQSRQEPPSGQQTVQQELPALSATASQGGDIINRSIAPLEWSFDDFPYDDSFYPLNWIVEGTGDALSVPGRGDEGMG